MRQYMKKFLLGAHMPTTGGFYHAAKFGQATGCSAIQIFTKSNRQWQAKPIDSEAVFKFKEAISQHNINYVVAHACYLINLASPDQETQNKSIAALEIELARCHELGINNLVLHPGSRLTQPEDQALKQVARNISLALANSPGNTKILIETMAGQGSTIGHTFEQLAEIMTGVKQRSRVGVCVDTCHIFAAGYDFNTVEKYNAMWQRFDRIIGIDKLGLIHLNDSKKELASRVDRHAEIGDGQIAISAFKLIMNDPKLLAIPKILETPKEDLATDVKNIRKLIGLLEAENLKYLNKTNLEQYLD